MQHSLTFTLAITSLIYNWTIGLALPGLSTMLISKGQEHPSRPTVQVVNGLSITFHAGKTAALVGASGSGKSTIVSLVEHFYDPTSSAVKIDGMNVKDLNLKWLHSHIGLVSQEPSLFSTTETG